MFRAASSTLTHFKIKQMVRIPLNSRSFSVSSSVFGGVKMKRKKQAMRAENPQLQIRRVDKTSKDLALANFDQYYSQFYGKEWNSMRLALLSRSKYCALVNNFADPEITVEMLNELGCINISKIFNELNDKRISPVRECMVELTEDPLLTDEPMNMDPKPETVDLDVSLNPEFAAQRYIDPESLVVGDGSTSMYDFVPTSRLKGMEDFVEDADYYDHYQPMGSNTIPIQICDNIFFPKHLQIFTFPRNVMDMFPPPTPGLAGNLNYYCLDGGSIFPVLALDVKPGQTVLDMCSAPGGKALIALQTLYPSKIVCNDINGRRLSRVGSVMEQYCGVGSGIGNVRNTVEFSKGHGAELLDYGVYDRVLCDVPCFSDRHAVSSDEHNVFALKMIKQRLNLPKEQCELLKAGLLYLKPGGSLVYSTCTLSPIQNEGVINMALKAIWEETTYQYYVNDLTEALQPFSFLCKIFGEKEGVKLGNMIVPHLSNNFGPIYFCKITRKS